MPVCCCERSKSQRWRDNQLEGRILLDIIRHYYIEGVRLIQVNIDRDDQSNRPKSISQYVVVPLPSLAIFLCPIECREFDDHHNRTPETNENNEIKLKTNIERH